MMKVKGSDTLIVPTPAAFAAFVLYCEFFHFPSATCDSLVVALLATSFCTGAAQIALSDTVLCTVHFYQQSGS